MLRWVIAALIVVAWPGIASAQDADAGKKVFKKKCFACHSVGEGAKHKLGPNLNGVIGRPAGTIEGFTFSESMKGSGITWDEATFKEYIADDDKKVPGNKMILPGGVKKELDRDDLYAYIVQFSK